LRTFLRGGEVVDGVVPQLGGVDGHRPAEGGGVHKVLQQHLGEASDKSASVVVWVMMMMMTMMMMMVVMMVMMVMMMVSRQSCFEASGCREFRLPCQHYHD
jgi:hypothetical protein